MQRVMLNGMTEALHVAPMLLLIDEVKQPPIGTLPTALQHIGWGSTDTGGWYEKAHAQGVAPDTRGNTLFNTNETPTIGLPGSGNLIATLVGNDAVPACLPQVDPFAYMYVLGPDQERVEICSGADARVNHLHFTTADISVVTNWYRMYLGLTDNVAAGLTYFIFYLDDVLFFFEPIGSRADYKPTDDHVLGHVAFSVSDLEPWLKRARDMRLEILAEPAEVHGFKSFFLRAPDGMRVEIVQAAASKELCADGATTLPPSIIPAMGGNMH
jgi:catechol 2,3-dioxygenase-like lactoylglutathione lyase family enzyme